MKFYKQLDERFTSELRVEHFKNQNEESTLYIYDRELRDYKKIVSLLKPDDWKQFNLHFDEKPLGWKFRLANCLQFVELKWAFPLWLRLYETKNAKIRNVITADIEKRKSKDGFKSLSPEEGDFISTVLKQEATVTSAGPSADEIPERFKNNIYNQKTIKLDGFLLWRWKKWRNAYVCCYASDKVVDQWIQHLNAGIELAAHFGEAIRTYVAVKPTDSDKTKIGSAFFLKSIKIIIYDGKRHSDRKSDYSLENESGEVVMNLELNILKEMTLTMMKRKGLWIEPPYIGWDLLEGFQREQVFLLPTLPDRDGEWLR